MIQGRVTTLGQVAASAPQEELSEQVERYGLPWVDQFAANMLLTTQALQRLHVAFDGKFTR